MFISGIKLSRLTRNILANTFSCPIYLLYWDVPLGFLLHLSLTGYRIYENLS